MGIGQHAKDLRSFLAEVEHRYPGELITVEREADLRFEISALLVKLDAR
jgi:3-polyprenyl-4-hydroxybenzoate decarboxylase